MLGAIALLQWILDGESPGRSAQPTVVSMLVFMGFPEDWCVALSATNTARSAWAPRPPFQRRVGR
jgi:hypothetical protein